MSWQSPGSEDGRRPIESYIPESFNFFSQSIEDTLDANVPSFASQSNQASPSWHSIQLQPRHPHLLADELVETSYPRGGINSPPHSRLAAYTLGASNIGLGHQARRFASQRSTPLPNQSDSDSQTQPNPLHQSFPYKSPICPRQDLHSIGRVDEPHQQQRVHQQQHAQSMQHNITSSTSPWSKPQSQNASPMYSASTLSSVQSSLPTPSSLGWQYQQVLWHHQQSNRANLSPLPATSHSGSSQQHSIFRLGESPKMQLPQSSAILPSISSLMISSKQNSQPLLSYSGIFLNDDHNPSPGQSFDTSHSSTTQATSNPSNPLPKGSTDESKVPLPQNLRGDPFRHAKVKTELCRNYLSPKGCIFGDKCNFAHGEHELQLKKLMAEEEDGKLDVEIFRTHPCFTWLATGACPFDQRCLGLHDPRVNGSQPSWLNHNEIMVNNNNTGKQSLQIDKLYHEKVCAAYSCSPVHAFTPKSRWNADVKSTLSAWREFYFFCCGMENDRQIYSEGLSWPVSSLEGSSDLTELNRVAIVLKMREARKARLYVYSPSHLFCDILCMVLQTRYFRTNLGFLSEISDQDYERMCSTERASSLNNIIVAREIAFGGVSDPQFREASIWFNIRSENIVPCTRQQARKNNIRSRHKLRMKWDPSSGEVGMARSCTIPPFDSNQPVDNAAFDLITDILGHRYRVLEYFSSEPDEMVHQLLVEEEGQLQQRFESQRRFWMTWSWPKKLGSNDFDAETVIPSVFGAYNFVTYGDRRYKEDAIFFGKEDASELPSTRDRNEIVSNKAKLATGFIWKSFVMNIQLQSDQNAVAVPDIDEMMPVHDPLVSRIRRLPVLRALSLGKPIIRDSSGRVIPTLINEYCAPTHVNMSLDVVIREWTFIYLQQKEKKKDNPIKEAQSATEIAPKTAQRRLVSYSFDEASRRWSRELPHYS